jgi:hypothetical protein
VHYPGSPYPTRPAIDYRRVVVTCILAAWSIVMTVAMFAILYVVTGLFAMVYDLAQLTNH